MWLVPENHALLRELWVHWPVAPKREPPLESGGMGSEANSIRSLLCVVFSKYLPSLNLCALVNHKGGCSLRPLLVLQMQMN